MEDRSNTADGGSVAITGLSQRESLVQHHLFCFHFLLGGSSSFPYYVRLQSSWENCGRGGLGYTGQHLRK